MTAGCKDHDHGEADDQITATADRAGNAVDSATDHVEDAVNDVTDAAKVAGDTSQTRAFTAMRAKTT